MKKFIITAGVIMFMMAGCGSDDKGPVSSFTEETTYDFAIYEDNDDEEKTTEETTIPAVVDLGEEEGVTQGKEIATEANPVVPSPEVNQASPIKNVNNTLFIDVSNAVRSSCNSSNTSGNAGIRSNWSSNAHTNEERIYVNTATKLIKSYARLNNCRKLAYDNGDVVTDDDIALLTEIEDGLGANVEIFLNTDTTDIMNDADFDYSAELNNLELSLQNKAK